MVHPCLMAHFDGAGIPGVTLLLERTGPSFWEDTCSLEATGKGQGADTSCQTSDDVWGCQTPDDATSGPSWSGQGQGKFGGQAQGCQEEPPALSATPLRPLSDASHLCGRGLPQSQQIPVEVQCPGLGAVHKEARAAGGGTLALQSLGKRTGPATLPALTSFSCPSEAALWGSGPGQTQGPPHSCSRGFRALQGSGLVYSLGSACF